MITLEIVENEHAGKMSCPFCCGTFDLGRFAPLITWPDGIRTAYACPACLELGPERITKMLKGSAASSRRAALRYDKLAAEPIAMPPRAQVARVLRGDEHPLWPLEDLPAATKTIQ